MADSRQTTFFALPRPLRNMVVQYIPIPNTLRLLRELEQTPKDKLSEEKKSELDFIQHTFEFDVLATAHTEKVLQNRFMLLQKISKQLTPPIELKFEEKLSGNEKYQSALKQVNIIQFMLNNIAAEPLYFSMDKAAKIMECNPVEFREIISMCCEASCVAPTTNLLSKIVRHLYIHPDDSSAADFAKMLIEGGCSVEHYIRTDNYSLWMNEVYLLFIKPHLEIIEALLHRDEISTKMRTALVHHAVADSLSEKYSERLKPIFILYFKILNPTFVISVDTQILDPRLHFKRYKVNCFEELITQFPIAAVNLDLKTMQCILYHSLGNSLYQEILVKTLSFSLPVSIHHLLGYFANLTLIANAISHAKNNNTPEAYFTLLENFLDCVQHIFTLGRSFKVPAMEVIGKEIDFLKICDAASKMPADNPLKKVVEAAAKESKELKATEKNALIKARVLESYFGQVQAEFNKEIASCYAQLVKVAPALAKAGLERYFKNLYVDEECDQHDQFFFIKHYAMAAVHNELTNSNPGYFYKKRLMKFLESVEKIQFKLVKLTYKGQRAELVDILQAKMDKLGSDDKLYLALHEIFPKCRSYTDVTSCLNFRKR